MKILIKLLNHTLTNEQEDELKQTWAITEIISLPENLQSIWSKVNPEEELDQDKTAALEKWITDNLQKNDYLLIQGEFGLTFYFVDFAFQNGFIPIYASTERVYAESKKTDGSVERKHLFKHVKFKKYRRYLND